MYEIKDNDEVIDAKLNNFNDIMISTSSGFSLWFDESEVPSSGIKSSGVKSMTLKNDEVVSMNIFDKTLEYVTIFTDNKLLKE